MEVERNEALSAECEGATYYFCSEGCRDRFLRETACKLPRTSFDLIIIGGGPAGLTAAIYSATLKMSALLIARDLGGQAVDSSKIENYMGFDFITGPELIAKFRHQLTGSHYVDHLMSEAEKVELVGDGFSVVTSELSTYHAKALLIASGMTRRKLNVPGEELFQRRGVFYGNIQDVSFAQDKDVAVIGGGNSALQMVENLQSVARNIHLVSLTELGADPAIIERVTRLRKVRVYEGFTVLELSGQDALSGLAIRRKATKERRDIPVQAVFVAIGLQPNSALVSHLVELNERREVITGPDCSTSCPGLFAAGDVTSAFGKRIIIACGEGAKAALAARQYLLDLRKRAPASR